MNATGTYSHSLHLLLCHVVSVGIKFMLQLTFFQLCTKTMRTLVSGVWSGDGPLRKHGQRVAGKEGSVLAQTFGGFMDTESLGLENLTPNSRKLPAAICVCVYI